MDYDSLLTLATDLGYRLLECGAEIYRVEESVLRILQAYGVDTGEVFAIPNCLIVSLSTPVGHPITRVRRMGSHATDVDLLERYNDLCRHLCQEVPSLEAASAQLEEIRRTPRKYPLPVIAAGYFFGAFFFTLFFGGTPRDALCSGLCGLALCLCVTFMTRLRTNLLFKTIAGAAVSALLALILTRLHLGQNSDLIIIGALMLLVPGVVFTNAMRDIMAGDIMAGITKSAEALLIGVAIALGSGAALWLVRLL